jgi:4-amino-4-deoxy-L-arabinose transferase-like glycosyltransferase
VLALLLAAIGGLRLVIMLGSDAGLHVDEAQYWDWSRHLQWGYYSKPPGVAALIALSTAVAGNGLLGVRWLTMLCWLASAGLMAALAWTMAGGAAGRGRAAAAWTLLLMAGTPAAGLLGLVATTDAPLVLCWAAVLAATWHALQSPTLAQAMRWWALAGLACGLGLLCKYTMAAVSLSAGWLLLLAWRGGWWRTLLPGLLLAGAVAAALLLPNLAWNAANDWPTLRHTSDITTHAARGGLTAGAGALGSLAEFLASQVLLLGPVAFGCLLRLWWTRARWAATPLAAQAPQVAGRPSAGHLALAFSLPLVAVATAQAAWAHAQMNWTAPALTGLCLWTGLAAARAGWGQRALLLTSAAALLLTTAVTGAPVLLSASGRDPGQVLGNGDIWARMRGWQPVFDALRPARAAHAGVPVVADDRTVLAQAAYGWRGASAPVLAWPAAGRPGHHYQLQQALAGWPPQVLWLDSRPPGDAQRARYARWQPVAEASAGLVHLGLWLGSEPVAAP